MFNNMSDDLSNKLVISAALAGAVTTKGQNPAVPYTPEEFGEEAKKCYDAGAAIVHIHARDPEKGIPTHNLDQIKAVIDSIHDKAPEILINLSTAIGPISSPAERIKPIKTFKPPLASLNTNSMNFSVGDFKSGKVVMAPGNIFANTFTTIQKFAKEMRKARTKPEMEVYDYGGMYNMTFLNKQEGLFEQPLHFQLVWGVLGGVLFANATTTNNPAQSLKLFESIKPGYGFGLRVKADKYSRTNFAIDLGFGHQSMGFYLAVSETF